MNINPQKKIECVKCGTCCIAPDIFILNKPVGVRCQYLTDDNLCSIYSQRPQVCRNYEQDEVCLAIRGLSPEERVQKYLEIYGLKQSFGNVEKG